MERCCSNAFRLSNVVSKCCGTLTGIVALAENVVFISFTYLLGFAFWAYLELFDFISAKWKSVAKTRRSGISHLICTLFPIAVVSLYAHIQRLNKDYPEMMTAIVAILVAMYHIARSIWGLIQLEQYKVWCRDAFDCLCAIASAFKEDNDVEMFDPLDDEREFEECLMVNNQVIDNEFSGTDLGIRLSKKLPFKLKANARELCAARWAVLFLCGFGHRWLDKNAKDDKLDMDDVLGETSELQCCLESVTFSVPGENERATLISVNQKLDDFARAGVRCGPYGSKINPFIPHDGRWAGTLRHFQNELENLSGMYPTPDEAGYRDMVALNRRNVSITRVDALIVSKEIGVPVLKSISSSYQDNRFRIQEVKDAARKLFQQQFLAEYAVGITCRLFPTRLCEVQLWNKNEMPNRRVMQASAQADLVCALRYGAGALTEEDLRNNATSCRWRPAGVLLDAVRTLLAEWVQHIPLRATSKSQWVPLLSGELFELVMSDWIISCITDDHRLFVFDGEAGSLAFNRDSDHELLIERFKKRLVWECILALRADVVKQKAFCDNNDSFSADCRIQLLFVLAYPAINITLIKGHGEHPKYLRFHVQAVSPNCTASVELEIPTGVGRTKLRFVHHHGSDGLFRWQQLISDASYVLKICDEVCQSNRIPPICLNVDLTRGMHGIAWSGWIAFNTALCQYEFEKCWTSVRAETIIERWAAAQRLVDEQVETARRESMCVR